MKSTTQTGMLVACLVIVSIGLAGANAEDAVPEPEMVVTRDSGGMKVTSVAYWTIRDGWVVDSEEKKIQSAEGLPNELVEEATQGFVRSSLGVNAKAEADCGTYDSVEKRWWSYTGFEAWAEGSVNDIGGSYYAEGSGTTAGSAADSAQWPFTHKAEVSNSESDWTGGQVEAEAMAVANALGQSPVKAEDAAEDGSCVVRMILDLVNDLTSP